MSGKDQTRKIEIINCHTHTFTMRHVPSDFPHPWIKKLRTRPWLTRKLAFMAKPILNDRREDKLKRLIRFQEEGLATTQSQIFDNLMMHYPGSTQFVVLPMDMDLSGYGKAEVGIRDQHRELYEMGKTDRYKDRLIPFASVHPDRSDALDIVKQAIEEFGCKGLKIYTKLGYAPDHKLLLDKIYPYILDQNLPVMAHCSRGGFRHRDWSQPMADLVTRPQAFEPVMKAFPEMRLCLAHFGGQKDWRRYVNEGYDPDDPKAIEDNWQLKIRQMITHGRWPNLYTDISYTLFHFAEFIPFLRLFLAGTDEGTLRLRKRVLFGSDFYMTRQEKMSERAVCFSLRNELGEERFGEMAHVNPREWLGTKSR